MKIPFTKMHGLGNDFILIDKRQIQLENLSGLSKRLCQRRFGVGADQMILLDNSRKADFMMRIFNADGSEVEMCGNGIRCLAKYIWDRNLSDKNILRIETLASIIMPEKAGDMVKVDMGEPVFKPEKIPVRIVESSKLKVESSKTQNSKLKTQNSKLVVDYPLRIKDREFKINCVSMGNSHAVVIVKDLSHFPLAQYGPLIETHPLFPKKTNVEFIKILNPSEIEMRVWERGSGETTACGTGASAAAVVSNMKGLTGKNVVVHLPGGDLFIEWAGDNHVYMTGPATEVFEGVIEN